MVLDPLLARGVPGEVVSAVDEHLRAHWRNGAPVVGVVARVRDTGVDVVLETGERAFVSPGHLSRGRLPVAPRQVVAVGQRVRMQLGRTEPKPGHQAVVASINALAPDPWAVIAKRYHPGDHVEGIVVDIQPGCALVELLPGARAALGAEDAADGYTPDVGDIVELGQRITVRLVSLDPVERRARLSLRRLHAHVPVQRPPAILPGGPAWLEDEQERTIRVLRRRLAEREV